MRAKSKKLYEQQLKDNFPEIQEAALLKIFRALPTRRRAEVFAFASSLSRPNTRIKSELYHLVNPKKPNAKKISIVAWYVQCLLDDQRPVTWTSFVRAVFYRSYLV